MNIRGIKKPRSLTPYIKYYDLGIRFALSIIIFLFIGKWLDQKLGTMPLFLVVGVFLGATAGLISIYRVVFPPGSKKQKKNNEN